MIKGKTRKAHIHTSNIQKMDWINRYVSKQSVLLFAMLMFLPVSNLSGEITFSGLDYRGEPLDHKLLKRLNYKNGFFIEAGANDGIMQSNTKLLEDYYGWTGILVEPSPTTFKRLYNNRTHSTCYQCALGSFEQDNTFVYGDFDGSLMSSIDGIREHRVPNQYCLIRSLQSILDELSIHHINFFSLDTEGYELQVLKGIDFEKTTFDYLLIEIYTSQYDEITTFLLNKGYIMIENFSNYSHVTHPGWDGTHNDYLFQNVNSIL